ncbi:MAG: TonB-dependent receptor [Acidobacteria bacterium]|nr:TonB-dependent receptor [Acidobacteriota bacterium]
MKKLLLAFLCAIGLLPGQTVSSSLRGVIVDSSGGAIPSADCVLTNLASGAALATKADTQGACVFPNVLAGTYKLSVKANGFRALEAKDIVVMANQTRTLGQLQLEVGGVSEAISISAEVSQIQLASAEKSGTIAGSQLQNIAVKGRDFFALLNTVPGVVDNFSQARETSSPDSIRGTFINGQRENQKNLAIDGITDLDTGSNSTVHFQPNMDAISEIRILTSNYQAEFGRNGGGVITVITKSGGKDFHGTGYYNYRNEWMNANSFFRNRQGNPKLPYRYRINGFTIGGPVYIPKVFNTEKNKLFFFFSQEYVGMKKDYGDRFTTMPTAAERNGDFSNSRDGNGNMILVRDPLAAANFPGNIIPKTRANSMGLSMLSFLPTPNWTDPDPKLVYARNYHTAYSGQYPKRQDMVRVDYNVSDSLQMYYRYIKDKDEQTVPWGLWVNGSVNWDVTPIVFGQPGKGHNFHLTKMFGPSLINEFIFGKSRNNLYFYPKEPEKMSREKVGNPGQWFKDSGTGVTYLDAVNYMPNMTFGGGISNSPNASWGNIPYENYNNIWSFVDNVSRVWSSHTLKAGIYIERTQKYQVGGGNYRGTFNFDRNANNPLDANHPFANALLGNFNSYSEATARKNGDWWFWNFEWFLQDNWKISRKLTLDAGVRFYHLPPQTDKNKTIASFDPTAYQRSAAPALYYPIRNAAGQRVAVNRLTGALAPAPLIGLFVAGSGNVANGAFIGGENGYPEGLYTVPWLSFGPRIGFAYDVFGNGKTAIRGGFGMFKDRMQGNPTMNTNGNPPVTFSPTLSFDTLSTYASAQGAFGPSNVSTLLGEQQLSTTMNFSFGIQQQVGSWAIDTSYVGGLSRHLMAQKNLNPIPMYARFVDRNPQNADPTNPSTPLADNFLRPYFGWGDINLRSNGYSSNYNALQMSATKRYSRGLQVGASYTFSKTLGVADGDTSGLSPYFSARQRNYGPLGFDRPHVFVFNYIYDLPKVAARLGVRPLRWVTDDWQISGMTAMQSGSPFTPGFGLVRSEEWTGSGEGARVNVTGDPVLPKDQRTFDRWFNTAAITMPAKGTFGNAGVNILRNPGIHNWDLAITKKFPIRGEGRWVQFRTEMFNVWNHTQYSGMGTGTSFDNATGRNTSTTFGVISGARDPRLIQMSLKLYF